MLSTDIFHELKPYPVMKDSGVQWLGQVPVHWEVKPLKRWVDINQSVLPETTDPDYEFRYLDIGAVGTGFLLEDPTLIRFGDAPSRARRILRKGDTIISTVRTYLKAEYFVANEVSDLVASTGFAVLTPRLGVEPEFLSLSIRSNPFIDRVTAYSVGTAYPAIQETVLSTFHVALPPTREEQNSAVRFCNHVDQLIRLYIRSKRRLLELLNEQKQVIVHRAVIRGQDSKIQFKKSKLSWLGDIPSHWVEHRAKYFLREVDERTTTGKEELLSVSHITGVSPRSQKNVTMFMPVSYVGHKVCQPGDLVINTMWAWMAALGVARQVGIVSPSYAVYRPRDASAFLPEYLDYLLHTQPYRSEFICRSTGIRPSRLRLYPDKFLQIPLVQPPKDEQERIVSFVRQETGEIDGSIARTNREIDLVLEYRTRLISDVSTGRLDVRGVELQSASQSEDASTLDQGLNEASEEEELVSEEENLVADE
jgi:type I restriction enzyme S subunit